MKPQDIPSIELDRDDRDVLVGDEEELLESDEDLMRVPRSGKRQLMPIERLR